MNISSFHFIRDDPVPDDFGVVELLRLREIGEGEPFSHCLSGHGMGVDTNLKIVGVSFTLELLYNLLS